MPTYTGAKDQAKEYYSALEPVEAPSLGGELIHFPSSGFNHLVYSKLSVRPKEEQIDRFAMLEKHALDILGDANAQIEHKIDHEIKRKKGSTISKPVVVHLLIFRYEKEEGYNVKLLVKQRGNGNKQFYDIMKYPKDI